MGSEEIKCRCTLFPHPGSFLSGHRDSSIEFYSDSSLLKETWMYNKVINFILQSVEFPLCVGTMQYLFFSG